jgi:hypothetical protein
MARRPPLSRLWLAGLAPALWLAGAPAPAPGEPLTPSEVPLAEVLEVMLLDRELLAIDAAGGGQISESLGLDETLLWLESRGRVGVAITSERLLAVGTGSASWQEIRYRPNEVAPALATLGDRVALAFTNLRVIGVDGSTGNPIEYRLGPRERVVTSQVGNNVVVVATDRAALGLSPITGGFFRAKLGAGERIESIRTAANLATLTTDRRVLIFRSPTGTWEQRSRDLR